MEPRTLDSFVVEGLPYLYYLLTISTLFILWLCSHRSWGAAAAIGLIQMAVLAGIGNPWYEATNAEVLKTLIAQNLDWPMFFRGGVIGIVTTIAALFIYEGRRNKDKEAAVVGSFLILGIAGYFVLPS